LSQFADSAQIFDYAVEAIRWAVGAGIINGDENGALRPSGNAPRAEVAMILMRYCK